MAIGNDKERLKPSCSPPPPTPPPQDPFQMVTLFFFYRKSSNYGDDKFPLTRFFSKKAYSLRARRVKFMKSSTSGSVKFVCISLDRPTRPSVCFRRIERLKIVSGTNLDLHVRGTTLINRKFV